MLSQTDRVAGPLAPWSNWRMANPMQDRPILQDRLPHLPWMDPRSRRLPGIQPVDGRDWLRLDEAYAAQMALRDRLIAEQGPVVHGLLPEAASAADELFAAVLAWLQDAPGFVFGPECVQRPDGVTVPLDRARPLLTLGQLVQEDLCLLQPSGPDYCLTGAILCFPASWTLAQKLGRPMTAIHDPVELYDADLAKRVNRLLEALRPDQPLWRMNFLTYDDHVLHQPRREGERRPQPTDHVFVRSERQCLLRLPVTRAVVFTIHTYVVAAESLTPTELAELRTAVH
jgi:dimethylamine monooxygenase subunit A